MTHVISEEKAFKIVQEFLTDILQISQDVLALYVIGSLGGGYYRPGQSDIDTAVIVRDNAAAPNCCLPTRKAKRMNLNSQ